STRTNGLGSGALGAGAPSAWICTAWFWSNTSLVDGIATAFGSITTGLMAGLTVLPVGTMDLGLAGAADNAAVIADCTRVESTTSGLGSSVAYAAWSSAWVLMVSSSTSGATGATGATGVEGSSCACAAGTARPSSRAATTENGDGFMAMDVTRCS